MTYGYDNAGEMTGISEYGATPLVAFVYDDLGRRTVMGAANGTQTAYGYDGASRLTSLAPSFASAAGANVSFGFGYNPAGQIVSRTSSNDAYSWSGAYNVSRDYSANGLNQYTASGSVVPSYDARGNLTSAGSVSYGYKADNKLLWAGSTSSWYYYDAAGRLDVEPGSALLDYAGGELIAERDGTTSARPIVRRYVYGPNPDEPLIWYEGAGTTDKRYLHADERGSVIAVSDASGQPLAINSYDEYGIPGSANLGRFQYTGQQWIASLGMYHYKARTYSPTLGRFLQTDPIGYGDGLNWYNYVGSDPINSIDPSGLQSAGPEVKPDPCVEAKSCADIALTATRPGFSLAGRIGTVPGPTGLGERFGRLTTQNTQTPSPCQAAFLKGQLASRGLPTSQIDSLKFVSGLNAGANAITRQAFGSGAIAVTQGSTVYVQPGRFNEVANFRSAIPFEEAYHTSQFASDSGFYSTYGLLSLGGLLSIGDSYKGNLYEAFAQGASQQMFEASKTGMCPRGG